VTDDANRPEPPDRTDRRDERDWRADYLPGVETVDQATPASPDELRVWRPWWNGYLTALSRLANHAAASRAVGMGLTSTKVDRKRFDHFALACHDACEEAYDLLEQTAFVRATAGERIEVTVTREEFDENGKLVARVATTTTKQRTSDALLARLLAAKRPGEYADRHELRHGGISDQPVPFALEIKRTPERIRELIAAMQEAGLVPPLALPPGEELPK
jgi:hypothetical protein